jgi:hypothetical protein
VVAEAATLAEEGHSDGQAPEPALSRGRGADQQLTRAGPPVTPRPQAGLTQTRRETER